MIQIKFMCNFDIHIVKIAKLLEKGSSIVVSIRIMTGKIPARSMFGNVLSRWIYTLLTGHHLLDNQSGLRGFSVSHIDWLLDVAGEKYDYEMNVLYYADKQRIVMDTIPIEAIYIDGNKSSHFSPVKDTLRIYKQLFTSARASLMATAICGAFALFVSFFLDYKMCMVTVPALLVSVFLRNKYFVLCIPFFLKYLVNYMYAGTEIKAYESFDTVDERVFTVLKLTDPDALEGLFSYGETLWWILLLHVGLLLLAFLLYRITMNRRVDFGE